MTSQSPSKHGRRPLWFRAFLFPMAAAWISGCEKPAPAAPPPPVVEVIEIQTSEVPLTTTLIGQLDSPQNVDIRARVEAFVDEALFTEGTEVKAGDVLFKLDRKTFLEKLAAANGALAEAHAALHKYEKDVDRLTPLVASRAVSQQDLDNALASVEVGKASVESAKARVESAQLDLGYCDIKAPITGLIGAKQVSIGDLVGKGEPTLLATISTLDPIWFYCNVSEVEYLNAEQRSRKLGTEVSTLPLTLLLNEGREHPDQGKFVFIDRAVDAKTGTLRVRAEFPNKDKLLRPGMFARVRVHMGKRKDSIVIPQRAVMELQGKTFVWVVSPENTATQRAVTLGEEVDSSFVVLDGLKPGERIITEGIHKVRDGTLVAVSAAVKSAPATTPEPAKE